MEHGAAPSHDFSGLVYRPDAEVGVYLLMGLLWNYLPVRIAFESFELDPKREGHSHTKYLDAKGKVLIDGQWKDSTFEFKLFSSGFIRDLARHPGLSADVLVCWIHDAPTIESTVSMVLALEPIYRNLPAEVQKRIILNPEFAPSRLKKVVPIEKICQRFSDLQRPKIMRLLSLWPEVTSGRSELRFCLGAKTIFRACAYSSEHLIICEVPAGRSRADIAKRFHGKKLQEGVRIPLNGLKNRELKDLVQILRGAAA